MNLLGGRGADEPTVYLKDIKVSAPFFSDESVEGGCVANSSRAQTKSFAANNSEI